MKTIPQQFKDIASRFPQRPALRFKYHGAYIAITFAELERRVTILAKGLHELGVGAGDRVAILSENRSEWIRTDLATLSLGGIIVPVHTTVSPQMISHILNDAGAQVLVISTQEQFNKIALIADQLSSLTTIIAINLDQQTPLPLGEVRLLSLDAVMELGEQSTWQISTTVQPDDLASIVYTSGTTALPKGVMLTHWNFLYDAEASLEGLPVSETDVLLSFLPLSHVLERTAGYYAPFLCRGACIAFAESPATLAANLREVKPTIIVAVPRVFEKIHKSIWDGVKKAGGLRYRLFLWALHQPPKTFKHSLARALVFRRVLAKLGGRFRFVISGGATLNHKLARFFERVGIIIIEGYGLTETAPAITCNRLHNYKFGTVGQQLPGCEVIIAPDKEILVRGPQVMKGYYHNEQLTRETIDPDGWLHTGDLGFMSSDGFLVIIGRKKEMISLSNGKIAWPEQLELLLNNDRLISQSIVFGQNRSYLTALLVPDWQEVNRMLEPQGIMNREPAELIKEPKLIELFNQRIETINRQLAEWEKIRQFGLLPREFSAQKDELTPTLKLSRHTIEHHFQTELDQLYRE